jgi:cobalt-zinc-cadmium efflux system membrane fusion protein
MTEYRGYLCKGLPHLANVLSVWVGRVAKVIREVIPLPAAGEAGHEAEVPYRPGARALPVNRQWRIVAALGGAALIVVAIILGFSALVATRAVSLVKADGQNSAAPMFQPTPEQLGGLTIASVKSRVFPAVTSTEGYIASDDDLTTPVFSPFSGRVVKLIAKLGDSVKKGQPLLVVQGSEFVQAQNDLVTARAQFNLAQTNEKRQHELYQSRGAALKDWQQSQVDLATASAALDAVRNRLRIVGKTDVEIATMERVPVGRQTSPDVIVSAPIDGTVIQRQVGAGQYIQAAASTPVYSISNLSTVWLIANVREDDAPFVHVGDVVNVRLHAFPGRVFRAKISYVAPIIDPATHRLQVRADVDNSDGSLKPQMFAFFNIVTGQDESAPAVPQSAIIYEGDMARVWVQDKNGDLGLRQLRVGRTDGDTVEALGGIRVGEKIVTGGAIFIDRAATSGSE